MRVTALHIDRFGILGEQDVPGLSPGVNIFLGHNEAGKSTCLRFFQSMLFGYKRGNRTLDPMAGQSRKTLAGGSLFLDTKLGSLTLTRRPGAHGGQLSLTGASGEELDQSALQLLFGGMTVDVFDSIFAFSLKNLMDFASLNGEQVRHALHGAAFGTGLQSPALVLKKLEERMAVFLKADRGSAAINNAWRELQTVQEKLRAGALDMDAYAGSQRELDATEHRLSDLRLERADLDGALRRVRRRRDVWEQWEAVRRIQAELAGLGFPATCGTADGMPESLEITLSATPGQATGALFAPDAVQRLDSLLAQREERTLAVQEHQEALALLEADIAGLGVPAGLAEIYPAVQSLREQKERRRSEAEALPPLRLEYDHLAGMQAECLDRLGPGWDAARVAGTDLSLAAGQRLQRLGTSLEAEEQALRRAEEERDRLAEELAEAVRQEGTALSLVAKSADLEPALPESGLSAELAADCIRAKAALADMPLLRERLERAEDETRQSISGIDPAWTVDTLKSFDASLNVRQRFSDSGGALAKAQEEAAEARRSHSLAERAMDEARRAAEAARERLERYADLPDSATLETRHGQLRQLQRLCVELDAARREYDAANEAVSNLVAPLRSGRPQPEPDRPGLARNPLFLAGGQLVLAGLALAGGGLLGHFPSFLYAGTGFVLFGLLACLLHGKAAPVEESGGREEEHALCRARTAAEHRKKTLEDSLSGLMRQASPWLSAVIPPESNREDLGETALARAARLLENQGREHALAARDQEEARNAMAAMAAEKNRLGQAEQELANASRKLEQARRDWVELLRQNTLSPALLPDNAAGLFDRIAAARARASAMAEAGASLQTSAASITACLEKAGSEPFFAQALSGEWTMPARREHDHSEPGMPLDETMLQRAKNALAALDKALLSLQRLREAEQARLRQESVLNERTDARERLTARLNKAEALRIKAALDLERTRQAWTREMAAMGFENGLTPAGATEALGMMRDFTAREKDMAARLFRLEAVQEGLQAFTREVVALAGSAGRDIPSGLQAALSETVEREAGHDGVRISPAALSSRIAAALHLLGALGARVESATRDAALLADKRDQHRARAQQLARAQSALELTRHALEKLLENAHAPDAESFRAAFALSQRVIALQSEEQALLAGLRRLAGEESLALEDLLESLDQSSVAALQEEEARYARAIEALDAEAAELSEKRGQTLERRAALAGDTEQAHLRAREAMLRESLHRLSRQWAVPALARELLLRAKKRFEEEGQEGVIRYAGDIFADITGHEYTGIAASLDGGAFTALHRSGDRRDPERQLSQGTREQLYLSLRLAYIRNHAAKAEAMPVIMDDILVNFDPERAANTARVLADVSRHNQLFFFTCHPAMADILLSAGDNAGQSPETAPAAFTINRGEISSFPRKAG